MRKKLVQSFIVAAFLSTCICFASYDVDMDDIDTTIIEEAVIVPHEEDTEIPQVIKKTDIDLVMSPMEPEMIIFATESVAESEPDYYVEVVDGYMTDGSIRSICEYIGNEYDISPELLQAMAWTESRYNPTATGSCGDKGLCQIVEKWHRGRMERLGVSDIYDPYGNILICADIISELMSGRYGNDTRYVLMAYNMGPTGAVGLYEAGIISEYATNVLAKAEEFGYRY